MITSRGVAAHLCLCLGLLQVFVPSSFGAAAASGINRTGLAAGAARFSALVDQDDPKSRVLLQELEHLSAQFEKRSNSLSLEQVLDQGLLNNPALAAAFYDIQGSEWSLIAARRSWYPTLQVAANANNFKAQQLIFLGQNYTSTTTVNQSGSSSNRVDQSFTAAPGLVLNWSFFDPTRTPAINQQLASLFAQRFLFDIAARNLVLNLQVAYTNVQSELELVRRYQWLLELTRRQVVVAEVAVRSGRMPRASLDQLHTEQRLQLTRLIDRYQRLFSASNALSELVAVPPGRMVLASNPLELQPSWQQDLDSTLRQALAMREEIKQKLALAARDRWSSTRAINAYLPVFGLTAGGVYDETSILANSVQTSKANIGLSFQWLLFDGGVKAADSTNLKSQADSQLSDAESQRLLVSRQVMDAYNVYVTSKLALNNTGADFALSKRTVQDAVNAFSRNRDVTTLVQVFNLYISAADRDVGSMQQFNNAVFALYRYSAFWPESVSQKVAKRRRGS